ncbi:MAG TPA: hypothetical protein VHX44_09325, partial [Planctomycetota bacterium]|nr:hypothetical protein [Planctomycetota bacterium]
MDTTTPLWRLLVAGTWRFILVSIAGFAPWVLGGGWFHRTVGEVGLYATCLVRFLLVALILLPGLLTGEARLRRTAAWFLPAFIAYAVLWCACWFLFHGRIGEIVGALTGGSAFALLTAWALGRPRSLLLSVLVFLAAHLAGYFIGGWAMHEGLAAGLQNTLGMLTWGLWYGIGFGAGIGWLVHA